MKVEIYSREAIKELMKGEFPKNTAVISFCSPRKTRRAEEVRVYFVNVCDRVFNILIPDIDIEILGDYGYTYETYLAEADDLAKFIYEVKSEGRDIICQCDFGQSRSAACAAADITMNTVWTITPTVHYKCSDLTIDLAAISEPRSICQPNH